MQRLFLLNARLVYSGKKLRPLLPNSKSSFNTSSICVLEYGRIVPDTSASLNKYSTFSTIDESVLTLSVDAKAVLWILRRRHPKSIFIFIQLVWPEFSEILSNLNIGKLAGPDRIAPKLPKIGALFKAVPMTKLFNYCIDVSEWPRQWKLSNVTPNHKNDDETSRNN